MTLPRNPFEPVMQLFLAPCDSDLLAFLRESQSLLESSPGLVGFIDADLDEHGLRKKALRTADAEWRRKRSHPLSGIDVPVGNGKKKPSVLQQGRPRTPGHVVLIAMLLRGYFGSGFKACDVTMMMLESMTLKVYFDNLGLCMPGRSTLTELLNAIGNETRQRILDAQVAQALRLGLDDFKTMLQDSTHVEGNTTWPTDSRLMVALVQRLLRVGGALDRVGLPVSESLEARKALGVMVGLDREIDMTRGRKESARTRKRRYERLLKKAHRVHKILTAQFSMLPKTLADLDILPSRKVLATRVCERLQSDLGALATVIANCEARVLRDEKVKMSEKILSVSDPDVGFIAKGQREPVIGYKPQLARSGAGFITGLLLPKGNASDSGQLVPMVDEVVRRTKVTPKVLSVDDGYASIANRNEMLDRGIEVISINGSKGRALTKTADWNSDEYLEARDLRSAVESMMFTLKQGFDFGTVARRGLPAVHAELLEKALAFNICHLTRRREAAAAKARQDEALSLFAA